MQRKSLIVATILVSLLFQNSLAFLLENQHENNVTYSKWRGHHKKRYHSIDEQLYRELIFKENLQKINKHNSNPNNTYKLALNQFSDLTHEEFSAKHLMKREHHIHVSHHKKVQEKPQLQYSDINPSVDWRSYLTPVKNQGACGACWTFSSAALMEFYTYIQTGFQIDLSEQQLVDCVNSNYGYTCNGCNGGRAVQALDYAMTFGVVSAYSYPYTETQGDCRIIDPNNIGFRVQAYYQTVVSVEGLKAALNISPVVISIDARNWSFYSSGIFNDCDPNNVVLTHSVLAVGYDQQGNWIVRNQWGTTWGDQGYITIAAGDTCGITQDGFAIIQ